MEHLQSFFDEHGSLRQGAARTGSTRLSPEGNRLQCPPVTPIEQISDALYIACRNAQVEAVHSYSGSRRTCRSGLTWEERRSIGRTSAVRAPLLVCWNKPAPIRMPAMMSCTARRAVRNLRPGQLGIPGNVRARLAEDATLANFMDGQTGACTKPPAPVTPK